MKVLLLDNYDSFTYNLNHMIEALDVETDVFRNDEIDIDAVARYDRIVISPGPGVPSGAGITKEVIRKFHNVKPILGVCLGLQAIAEVCGGRIRNSSEVFHGIAAETHILDKEDKIFNKIESPFLTGRYHSWYVDNESVPDSLYVTAIDDSGYIMAMRHENNLLRGVQFHPESILTQNGKRLISNWLFLC